MNPKDRLESVSDDLLDRIAKIEKVVKTNLPEEVIDPFHVNLSPTKSSVAGRLVD